MASTQPKVYPKEDRRCNEHDSNSEAEANTSEIMPDEPVADSVIKSADADDHNQPASSNSSDVMESQSIGSEFNNKSEKLKDQQEGQVLQKNSDSNSKSEGNTSQNMADEITLEIQSNDGDNDNQLKLLPSSPDEGSEQNKGSYVNVGNFSKHNNIQSHAKNNKTRRELLKYYIGILILSVLVILIAFIISYGPPQLLITAIVLLLFFLICLLLVLAKLAILLAPHNVSYRQKL